ncbi:hypothetical protein PGIGA_G00154480 [Pangasianodon gigas]|uniref:Uncharacterized protein n=1 Tax=Pangasianodon gigas TaxID=30993 RepID=A0ACC5XPL7_PANGG|nr:hypothetical protein [Pangasianodon gigas]
MTSSITSAVTYSCFIMFSRTCRNQNGDDTEETADMECSPYAVGSGEEEIKFRSKQDTLKQEDQEKSTDVYSDVI